MTNQRFFEAVAAHADASLLSDWWTSIPAEPCTDKPYGGTTFIQCSGNAITDMKLDRIGLTAVPEEISCLTSLDYLVISNNEISEIPGFLDSLVNLELLSFSGNPLTSWPSSFPSLTALSRLFLEYAGLIEVPEFTITLTGLTKLLISGNNIVSLPTSFPSTLLEVYAAGNNIASVPDALISAPAVVTIDLDKNEISALPSGWTAPNLRTLRLEYNKIETIPCFSGLAALVTLKLGYNLLQEVPECLNSKVSVLTLSGNRLSSLPVVSHFSALTELNLSYNVLSLFPPTLCDLTSHEFDLSVEGNQVTELPACIANMKLRKFYLGYNKLTVLPDPMPSTITEMHALHNKITNIPTGMTSIRNLYLQSNAIVDTAAICDCTLLENLFLGENPLTTLDPCVSTFSALQVLSFEGTLVSNADFLLSYSSYDYLVLSGTRILSVPELTVGQGLYIAETCVRSLPASILGSLPVVANCTYLQQSSGVQVSSDYFRCPWLHCSNAQEDPVAPGREEISFNEFGPCRAGYECSGIGPGTFCPEGKYSLGGASECSDVPVFYYTPATRDELLICPPGHTCAGGSAPPDPCPENTYKAVEGDGECLPCDLGMSSPAGASQCGFCSAAGVYHDGSDCRTCERGFKCLGDDTKVACGAGEYMDTTGASACKTCPANTVPSADHTTCEAPPAGSEVVDGEAVPCSGVIEYGQCKPCPYDHVCADGVATPYVTDCTGTTLESVALDFVTSMEIVTDTTDPNPCNWAGTGFECLGATLADGFKISMQAITTTGILPLNIGCFGSALQRLSLMNAVGGLHGGIPASVGNLTAVTELKFRTVSTVGGPLPNTIKDMSSLEWLWVQEAGWTGEIPELPVSLKGIFTAFSCLTGEPVNMLGATALEQVDIGCSGLVEGSVWNKATQMAASPYLQDSWFTLAHLDTCSYPTCNPCVPGTKKTGVPFECLECEAGHFCVDGVQTICPPGTWSAGGAASCTRCALGTYSSEAGRTTECIDVPTTGQVVNPVDPTKPLVCGAGTYSKDDRTGCDECLPGSSCPGGDITPLLCAKGSYQDAGAQGLCLSVGAGQYQDKEGQTGGVDVPAGSYTSLSTRDVLNECPENFACAGLDAQPVPCTNPTPAGSSVCAAGPTCTAGEFLNGAACETCPANTFSNTVNAPSCTDCPEGTSSSAGASSCDPIVCAAGEYLDGSSCETCSAGTYSAAGADSCTACETGYASPAGASACQPCAGFGDAQFCKVVEHPEFGTVLVPHTCPEDSYITGDARMECKKCSADYKCDGTTKHEFTLAPFTSVDPTTASGFLTLMAIILVLAGAAGGTMFGISVKKRTQAAKPADNTVIGELIVV